MDVGSCVGVDSQMMDMIRVIGWWPRVYTKNKSKADVRSRGQKNVDVVAATVNKILKKNSNFRRRLCAAMGISLPPASFPLPPLRTSP
jgi:hypothetical protein